MEIDKAQEASKGRVWTGKQAKERGLIDEMGGINTAVLIAKDEAGIARVQRPIVKFYSEPRGFQISTLFKNSAILNQFTDLMDELHSLDREKILTIMPFNIDIK